MIKQAGSIQWLLNAPKTLAKIPGAAKVTALIARIPAVGKIIQHARSGAPAALKVMGVLSASEGSYYVGRNYIGDWIGNQLYGPNQKVLLNNPDMATVLGSGIIGAGAGGLASGIHATMSNDENEGKKKSVGQAALLGALGGGAVGATTPALFTMLGRRGL